MLHRRCLKLFWIRFPVVPFSCWIFLLQKDLFLPIYWPAHLRPTYLIDTRKKYLCWQLTFFIPKKKLCFRYLLTSQFHESYFTVSLSTMFRNMWQTNPRINDTLINDINRVIVTLESTSQEFYFYMKIFSVSGKFCSTLSKLWNFKIFEKSGKVWNLKISQNTFFIDHLRRTASDDLTLKNYCFLIFYFEYILVVITIVVWAPEESVMFTPLSYVRRYIFVL